MVVIELLQAQDSWGVSNTRIASSSNSVVSKKIDHIKYLWMWMQLADVLEYAGGDNVWLSSGS